jgi:hypothetical protein
MNYNVIGMLIPVGLFAGILFSLIAGQRLGLANQTAVSDSARARLSAVEAAIFGLMGLMIAFTFSGAAQRYELRWQLVVDEANAVGTSYLRLDLLPASKQAALRDKYRRYVETRLTVYRVLPDIEASSAQAAIASSLQQEIWTGTIAALTEAPPHATIVVLPALNAMIDVATSRAIAMLTHTPTLIMIMLVVLGLVCSLLAGDDVLETETQQARLHLFAFTLIMTATIYVIFDLDYPRYGLIRLDFSDQALQNVLASMK